MKINTGVCFSLVDTVCSKALSRDVRSQGVSQWSPSGGEQLCLPSAKVRPVWALEKDAMTLTEESTLLLVFRCFNFLTDTRWGCRSRLVPGGRIPLQPVGPALVLSVDKETGESNGGGCLSFEGGSRGDRSASRERCHHTLTPPLPLYSPHLNLALSLC